MRVDETNIKTCNDARPPIEEQIFSNGAKEIELSKEVFDLLYLQLLRDKAMFWTGEKPISEIKSFYYPFSNCKITALE